MAILSFRKLISSIFIFLSVAGILYCTFGLFETKESNMNEIVKIITFACILGASYYTGYIFVPERDAKITDATCNAIRSSKKYSSGGGGAGLYDSSKPSSDEDQVFNLSPNIFRYDQADMACKKFGAKVATIDQLKNAYRKGANWCNYGWTQGGFALYPIQPNYFNTIQKTKGCEWSCGSKPGIIGGRMDAKFTFGVNCYGKIPANITAKPNVLKCQKDLKKGSNNEDILIKLKTNSIMVNTFN